MPSGIGSHTNPHKGFTDDWLTPPEILAALQPFELDPATPIDMPWATAHKRFTVKDNGLMKDWTGRVWLNPPYGPQTGLWLRRLAAHGNGMALVFARTETEWFHAEIWRKASALFFFEGRLHFHHLDGSRSKHNAGGPSVLVAYGEGNSNVLSRCELKGQYLELR